MGSDLELLQAWRGGDRVAGSELADRHFERLWRFFRLRVTAADVPDLIQRTLLGAVESRDRSVQGDSFAAYLLGIARRILLRYFAEHRRAQAVEVAAPLEVEDFAVDASEASPASAMVVAEEHRLLLAALRALSLDDQLVLELSFWEELSGAAIAEVLECAPGTVKSRVHRARQRLREAVERLAKTPQLGLSTSDNLDRWARSLRWFLGRTSRPAHRDED